MVLLIFLAAKVQKKIETSRVARVKSGKTTRKKRTHAALCCVSPGYFLVYYDRYQSLVILRDSVYLRHHAKSPYHIDDNEKEYRYCKNQTSINSFLHSPIPF